jgi:nicotinamide mononucleotide (NMN) deamidase PncC
MDANTRQLVQAIHDSKTQLVLVAAGAGTLALSHLLNVAGASRTLLEALVPYSEASFDEFLGQTPVQYVAEETARLMAGRAYTRARWLQSATNPVVGLSCTATIVTDRPKRGEHRAFIAVWQPEKLKCISIQLEKGARDRAGEEAVVSNLMLSLLAEACGLEANLPLPLGIGDQLTETLNDFEENAQALLNGELPFFTIADNGRLSATAPPPQLLLSGSFNPLHKGHLKMAQAASSLTGKPAAFELPATNADKPPLPRETVLHRLAQFAGRHTVYVSTAPTFIEKSKLYPGTIFVVGYDTAQRILEPRFYENSYEQMLLSLSEIAGRGCSFLVAGRVDDNGRFQQAADLTIPPGFEALFTPIPFRKDISSTELRHAGQKGSR